MQEVGLHERRRHHQTNDAISCTPSPLPQGAIGRRPRNGTKNAVIFQSLLLLQVGSAAGPVGQTCLTWGR